MRLKIETVELLRIQVQSGYQFKKRRQSKADQEAKLNVEKSRRPKPKISSRTRFVETKQQVQGNTSGVVIAHCNALLIKLLVHARAVRY